MSQGLDVLGADSGGLPSLLFQTGGGVIDYVKQSQAEGDAAAKANSALKAAITADNAATNAVARAKVSAALAAKVPSKAGAAKADQMAADTATATQDTAGAAVPPEKQADRVKAAQAAVDAAKMGVETALREGGAPQQLAAQARLDAANQTLTKAQGGAVDSGGGKGKGASSGSVFSKTLVGPVKLWHALVALVAGVGGTIAYKKLHK
jgi:hypothetical protein